MKLIVVAAAVAVPSALLLSERAPDAVAERLLESVNTARAAHGLPMLVRNVSLDRAATMRAEDMRSRQYFDHVTPDGRTLADFLASAGYAYQVAGENLAVGFAESRRVIDAWLASPTHRANILADDYDDIGIGVARDVSGRRPVLYVVAHFGRHAATGTMVSAVARATPVTAIATPSAGERYARRLDVLQHELPALLGITRGAYALALLALAGALAYSIQAQLHRTHPHVVGRAVALGAILVTLLIV